jgi:hypothetical protein
MRNSKERKHPETFYQQIVKKYIARKYGCFTVRELNFGGPKFDVVGFCPESEEFYIVECKRTSRPVGVGQTFGQILAYQAMIYDQGETFLNSFERAVSKSGGSRDPFWIHAARFVSSGKIPVRFFVALREKACSKPDILRLMKRELKGVGIIRINPNNQCKDYIRAYGEKDLDLCAAARIEVPISLPIRPELKATLDHRGSNRAMYSLASKLDAKIVRLKPKMKSGPHGRYGIYYRITRNFVGLIPTKNHIRVNLKEGLKWRNINVSNEAQLRRVVPKIRKALERTLEA